MGIKYIDKNFTYECENCKEGAPGYHASRSLTIYHTGEKKYLCKNCRRKLLQKIYDNDPDNTFYRYNYIPNMCEGLESEMIVYNNKKDIVEYYMNYNPPYTNFLKAYSKDEDDTVYYFILASNIQYDWVVLEITNLDLSEFFPHYKEIIKQNR